MNYKKITLVQIEYFLALARYLNFTEAAKNLYISQPSLSKQIALLESSIGVELFYRNKRDVRLTASGVVLLREVGGVIEIIESSIEKSKNTNLGDNITLVIGCLDGIDSSKLLIPFIKKFREKYPTINIVLKKYSFKMLREKLINGSLDIAFTLSFEIEGYSGMISNSIYRGNSIIIMDKSNPLSKRESILINDLKEEPFLAISRNESPNGFDRVINSCRRGGFTPKIEKQLPNIESILESVEAGMGVAIFDSNFKFSNNEDIKLFKIDDDYIDVIMTWKKENMNTGIPIFTNYLMEEIKKLNNNFKE